LLDRWPRELPRGGFVEEMMGLEAARRRDGEGWGREEKRNRGLPRMYATSSQVTDLDLFGPVVRPEQRLGTSMIHFGSSWTGTTQHHKFEDRLCILLYYTNKINCLCVMQFIK
jgi:hypothetical protein